MQTITTQAQALKYLDQYIPQDREFKFPGEVGLARTTYLLKLLGEPQNKVKVIHIAGTSGKGSTSYFISVILKSLGFQVGLSVSPILLDIKERFQINNELLSPDEFCRYLREIIPSVEQVALSQYGQPTYYEVLVALTYYIFAKKQVDYAVIETGLGGLLDGTNVVTSPGKVAVITQVGHDHTAILGKTLGQIAAQKAGIIHLHNIVVTCKQHPHVMRVIKETAAAQIAQLHVIDRATTKHVSLLPSPQFDFHYRDTDLPALQLAMMGSFQVQNCSLALAVASILSVRDQFKLDAGKVRTVLARAVFPGRMQALTLHGQTVVLDGAHNPQKMQMLAKNLALYFPKQPLIFMVSLRRGKSYKTILRQIIPLAKTIIVTPFESQTRSQGFSALAEDTKIISRIFRSLNFKRYVVCKSSREALELLQQDKDLIGVITGSLYLLSEVYPHLTAQTA